MKLQKTLIALALVSLLAAPSLALAQDQFGQTVTAFSGTSQAVTAGGVVTAIINIVNPLLALLGIVAVVFIVIGGVRYLTSQGDEDAVAAAKNTIIYAIVGLVIVFISAAIVNIIFAGISGT